ncbi:MAG: endonuclease [Novosphingobium sp. 28-62-57]|uniref:endonuclease/exonuclease/phosphatase family protein n=1 Tax=unclassified Novosphingobium TaxID=2644732 RepID=UPI000BD240FE|nr:MULTISPECIES: endonuclease/exonuclease/phosphatase family protein [unclassified Novosphingobium]OYW49233.1 MAG: endonuclease [Novosphingobium sp. 12-62-10]OYZ23296.1 MAG: endonuclease [Novosphingobium sp. 16-62-11]OZA35796.1 MAG: endonuclease [Novosphingobium sp. 17-62-9]OYZ09740.1 MAG: endonuclease [Novosphingobium sp. 28-62-57]HQS70376.1 endonuclease/exonuclease/phosphatase family protein [Novosphingobium sp.]
MQGRKLKVASYNIHKGVGLDRRRDPDRILTILREIDADVIALQEADRRFGLREAVIPRATLDDHSPWIVADLGHYDSARTAASLGWHGNALLVRRGIEIVDACAVPLPTLEPRGAVCVTLRIGDALLRVVGMHLDLSGLRRRQQVRAVCDHVGSYETAGHAVMMGDLNEWSVSAGALSAFAPPLRVLAPGRSFPARRPLAQLDRIVVSEAVTVEASGVHHSALAAVGSDHLPVWAALNLP